MANAAVSGYEIATGDVIGDGSLSGFLNLTSLSINGRQALRDENNNAIIKIDAGLRIAAGGASLINTGDQGLQQALRTLSMATGVSSTLVSTMQAASTVKVAHQQLRALGKPTPAGRSMRRNPSSQPAEEELPELSMDGYERSQGGQKASGSGDWGSGDPYLSMSGYSSSSGHLKPVGSDAAYNYGDSGATTITPEMRNAVNSAMSSAASWATTWATDGLNAYRDAYYASYFEMQDTVEPGSGVDDAARRSVQATQPPEQLSSSGEPALFQLPSVYRLTRPDELFTNQESTTSDFRVAYDQLVNDLKDRVDYTYSEKKIYHDRFMASDAYRLRMIETRDAYLQARQSLNALTGSDYQGQPHYWNHLRKEAARARMAEPYGASDTLSIFAQTYSPLDFWLGEESRTNPESFSYGYRHYLTNPDQMDTDLAVGFYVSATTATISGTLATGGLLLHKTQVPCTLEHVRPTSG